MKCIYASEGFSNTIYQILIDNGWLEVSKE
jgi:hypothetical protein